MFVYFLDTGNELVINKRQSIEKMVGCLFVYVRVSLKVSDEPHRIANCPLGILRLK